MKGYQKTNTKAQDLTEIVYKQNGFLSGLNTDTPKSDVGDTQVTVLENLIPFRDRLEARGGLKPNNKFPSHLNANAFTVRNVEYLYYDEDWDALIYPGYVATKSGVYEMKFIKGFSFEFNELLIQPATLVKIGNKIVISTYTVILVLEKINDVIYLLRPLTYLDNPVVKVSSSSSGSFSYVFKQSFVRKVNGVVEAESGLSPVSVTLTSATELDGVITPFYITQDVVSGFFPVTWDTPDGGYENLYTHIRYYRTRETTAFPEVEPRSYYFVGDYDLALGAPASPAIVSLDFNITDDDLVLRERAWQQSYIPFTPTLTLEASSAFLIGKDVAFGSGLTKGNQFIYTPFLTGDNQKYFGWYDPLFQYGASVNGDITCIKDLGTYCMIATKGKTYYVDTVNYSQDEDILALGIFTPILSTTVLVDDTIGINFWHRNAAVKVSQGEIIALTSSGEIRRFSNFRWGVDLSRGKVHSITKGKILNDDLSASAAFANDTYWLVYRESNPLSANYQILNTLRLGTTEESGYGFTVISSEPNIKGDYLNAGGWPYVSYIGSENGTSFYGLSYKGYHVDVHAINGVINTLALQNQVYDFSSKNVNNLLEYTGDFFDRKLGVDVIDFYDKDTLAYSSTTYFDIETKVEFPEVTASSESYFIYLLKTNFFLRKDRYSFLTVNETKKGYEITTSDYKLTGLGDTAFSVEAYVDESESIVDVNENFQADSSVIFQKEVQGKRIRIRLRTVGGSYLLTGMEATFKRDKRKDVRSTASTITTFSLSDGLFCLVNGDMENEAVPVGRVSYLDTGAPIEGAYMRGSREGLLIEGSAYTNTTSPTGESNAISLATGSIYELQLPEKTTLSAATVMFWFNTSSDDMSIKTGWNAVYADTTTAFQLSKVGGTWTITNGISSLIYTLPVLTEDWNHIAFVAKGGNNWDVYINGVVDATTSTFALLDSINSNSLLISGKGEFYDLRMYGKQVTGTEIKFYYDEIINNNGELFYGY